MSKPRKPSSVELPADINNACDWPRAQRKVLLERAIAVRTEHPDWNDKQVGAELGFTGNDDDAAPLEESLVFHFGAFVGGCLDDLTKLAQRFNRMRPPSPVLVDPRSRTDQLVDELRASPELAARLSARLPDWAG